MVRQGLSPEVRFFAESRMPASPEELVKYADLHYACKTEAMSENGIILRNNPKYNQTTSNNIKATLNEQRPLLQENTSLQESRSMHQKHQNQGPQRAVQTTHQQTYGGGSRYEKKNGMNKTNDVRNMPCSGRQTRSDKAEYYLGYTYSEYHVELYFILWYICGFLIFLCLLMTFLSSLFLY